MNDDDRRQYLAAILNQNSQAIKSLVDIIDSNENLIFFLLDYPVDMDISDEPVTLQ